MFYNLSQKCFLARKLYKYLIRVRPKIWLLLNSLLLQLTLALPLVLPSKFNDFLFQILAN